MPTRTRVDEALNRSLQQQLRESRHIDRRPRFERAVSIMARTHPGCRFLGLTAKGRVFWPGIGRFYIEFTLEGVGSAWVDIERRRWLWQPPNWE